jgi:hypothetical protein
MAEKPNQATKPEKPAADPVPPVPSGCRDDAMYILETKAIKVLGTFNAGLVPTKVEFGVKSADTFEPDPKITHPAPPAADITQTEIRVQLTAQSGTKDGLKYVRVTQGERDAVVRGVSKKGIFTVW